VIGRAFVLDRLGRFRRIRVPIGYTLTVSNSGPGVASSVDLNDHGWRPHAVSGAVGNQVLGCSFGNLAVGAAAEVQVASPTTSASCQTFGNTPLLTADNNTPIQSTANITVQCVPLAITGPAALPSAAVNVPYFATTMSAVGGTGTFTWSASGLPGGMSIGNGTGAISGTPTTTTGSPFKVSITAVDGNGTTVLRSYALAVLPFSECDVNQVGSVTVADVQAVINQALGIAAPSGDLQKDGVVNVIDVQMAVNAALGFGCAALGEVVRPERASGARDLAKELGPRRITENGVAPGPIHTDSRGMVRDNPEIN
jgi:hypothetical protein